MWISFLLTLLVLSWVTFVAIYRRKMWEIAALSRARLKIQVEEERVFEFLHGLGEAFTEDIRASDLHRQIVEGATQVVDAEGGSLYLVDRDGKSLVPSFVSDGCPPFGIVPVDVIQQLPSNPSAVQNYLRLHAIAPGEGILGETWQRRETVMVEPSDPRLAGEVPGGATPKGALVAPLVYRGQNLGLLAVGNGPSRTRFSDTDLAVFRAVAEQSAFALYSAAVYREASEKKRMDVDLELAQDIQRILLPLAPPQTEHFEVAGMNVPARRVSGDYFGYIKVDPGRWGVAIADVSGKGLPASLIMAMCRSVLRSHATGNASPSDVLHKVNRELYPDIKEDMFISMAYVILEEDGESLTLCRAGHDAPFFYSARTGTVRPLNPKGMALGIDSGDVFNRITGDFSVTLERGDCLILYTDGVTEALDPNGEEFGVNRTVGSIQASARNGAAAIVSHLTEALRDFAGTQPQSDDITLIAIRRK